MPLLGVRSSQIRVFRKELWSVGIGERIGWKAICQHVQVGNRAVHSIRVGGRCSTIGIERFNREEWRVKTRAGIGEWAVFLSPIEDSVSTAQHELIGNLVSQSHSRRKIV